MIGRWAPGILSTVSAPLQPLRIALAQIDTTVGDIAGNAGKVRHMIARARDEGAQLVVFPELTLTGYPPEDLLIKTGFLDAAGAALQEVAVDCRGIAALVGFPERADDVYNAAAALADGAVAGVYRKMWLPNYGTFDEQRYFQAGDEPALIELNGVLLGLTICEDIWGPGPPTSDEALAGAHVIVNLSASPYEHGKGRHRERMLVQRARDYVCAMVFCNLVGGQDELVFDGHSVAIDQEGRLVARLPQFEEALGVCTIDPGAVAAERLQDARYRAAVRLARRTGDGRPLATLARLQVEVEQPGDAQVGGTMADPLSSEEEV